MKYLTRNVVARQVDEWVAPAGVRNALEIVEIGGQKPDWFALVYLDGPAGSFTLGENAYYHDGWNNSFHEAHYMPAHVVAWGKSPSAARRVVKAACAILAKEPRRDSSTIRAERRNLVRGGD